MTAYDVASILVENMTKGATVDAEDGQLNPHGTGYYVGGLFPSLVFDSVHDVDRGELAWWIGTHSASLYGVWVDDADGKVYFDGTQWAITEGAALQLGRNRGEIAIWDIENNQEIRCDEPKPEVEPERHSSGFKVGDHVTAAGDLYDAFPETWVIYGFGKNALGQDLVRVHEMGWQSRNTSFYPHELTLEDGSLPSGE